MKILHLGKYFPPEQGGVEQVTYVIAKGATKAKHEVTVIVSNTSQKYKEEIIEGIRVIRLPLIYKIFRVPFTPSIISLIEEIKPDLIHLHIPNPWFELNLLFYLLFHPRVKVVATYHSDVVNYTPFHFIGNLLRYPYLYILLQVFCQRVIATSPNYVSGSFILSLISKKVLIVPLGIDIPKFRTREKIRSNRKILLYFGRLFPYKGLEYLLDAVRIVANNRDDFILYIVGDGVLKNKLENQVKLLKIGNFVKFDFTPTEKDKLKYYNSCDMFVLPSFIKSEAFGIVQLEAMAFGKPVISVNIPGSGVPYVNVDGITGKIVQPMNSEDLAKSIIELLDHEKTRLRLGKNARERVKKYFDQNKMVKDILSLYNQVMKG